MDDQLVPVSYHYMAYGLTIRSDRALPMLVPTDGSDVDLCITFAGDDASFRADDSGELVHPRIVSDTTLFKVWRTRDGGLRLRVSYREEYCAFVVNATGTDVSVYWSARTPLQDVLLYLVGPVLGSVLRLRGALCLHGSVLTSAGGAFVLIGPKRSGKSTTAAALAASGCNVLADDVAVIALRDGTYMVESGYSGMRLRPSSAAHLFGDDHELPDLWSSQHDREYVQRSYVDLSEREGSFSTAPHPLTALYVLGPRLDVQTTQVHEVPRTKALLALASNAYVDYALTDSARLREWKTLEHMLRTVPVRGLVRPNGLDRLDEICNVILEDHDALAAAQARP
jgi:hypothetical protein